MPTDPPDRGLGFKCSRRDFWPALLQEFQIIYGSIRGGQGGQLSQLRELDDERLSKVRPMVNPEYEILVEQEYVCCQRRGTSKTRKLFRMNKENLATFNQFTGQRDLAEIGAQLAKQMGWDADQGLFYARELFLALVDRLVCIPRDPPELPGLLEK